MVSSAKEAGVGTEARSRSCQIALDRAVPVAPPPPPEWLFASIIYWPSWGKFWAEETGIWAAWNAPGGSDTS